MLSPAHSSLQVQPVAGSRTEQRGTIQVNTYLALHREEREESQ